MALIRLPIPINIMKHTVIGLGCTYRAGKDSVFNILQKYLPVYRVALADSLKEAIDPLCREYFNISSLTDDDNEKALIRPLLVAFGCGVRSTNPTAWIDKARIKIGTGLALGKIVVITDIRFDEFSGDEADFTQSTLNGLLVNIDRVVIKDGRSVILGPANEVEAKNYPKIKARADVNICASNLEELEQEVVAKILPYFK